MVRLVAGNWPLLIKTEIFILHLSNTLVQLKDWLNLVSTTDNLLSLLIIFVNYGSVSNFIELIRGSLQLTSLRGKFE